MKQSAGSRLHLALELVENAPIGVLGNERLRAGLDQPSFIQAQRVEANRILGIVIPPDVIASLVQHLLGIVVTRGDPTIDPQVGCAVRIRGAQIQGFKGPRRNNRIKWPLRTQ